MAKANYPIPLTEIRLEMEVANSRFIATLAPAFSVDEAKDFFLKVKAEFPDASHNVPAFLIGHGDSEIAHCSDAGEPSGTAGKPMLAVLRGSGLGDVAVVVTRYFGGVKLGTGGLVRAYGDAVRLVVSNVQRAQRIPATTAMIALPYSLFESVRRLTTHYSGNILDQDFAGDITLTIQFPSEKYQGFNNDLVNLSNGSISAVVMKEELIVVPI